MASDALVWEIIRPNNSFLRSSGLTRRSGKLVLSAEPFNPLCRHSFKDSGMANSKAVEIGRGADGVYITLKVCTHMCACSTELTQLLIQKPKKQHNPSDATYTIPLKKGWKKSLKTLDGTAASHFYRADLRKAFFARYASLYCDDKIANNTGKRWKVKPLKLKRKSAKST
jgi:hypothetical protein